MDISRVPIGANPPHEINVVVEIAQGGAPIKYEMDKESGAMFVDRFLSGELRLHTAYVVGGWRSHRLHGDLTDASCVRRGGADTADRRAAHAG
jgi:inorganic pyrophosphatase